MKKLEKNSTVLVLMDFQNDLLDEKGKAAMFGIFQHAKEQQAIKNTKKLLDKARTAGIEVIFVKVQYSDGYPELTTAKAPIFMAASQINAMIKNTWGSEICNELKPLDTEIVITKDRINPFTNPKFTKRLSNFKTLILAGVATNFVVESTARTAADLDYEVFVVENCCASMNKQMHDFSITKILPNISMVTTVDEIINQM